MMFLRRKLMAADDAAAASPAPAPAVPPAAPAAPPAPDTKLTEALALVARQAEEIRRLHAERAIADAGITDPDLQALVSPAILGQVELGPDLKPKQMSFRERAMALAAKMTARPAAPAAAPAVPAAAAPAPQVPAVPPAAPAAAPVPAVAPATLPPPSSAGQEAPLPKDLKARAKIIAGRYLA